MSLIGARRPRVEDERLVTGRGRFAADDRPPGLCHLVLLRSPHPHARVLRVDVSAARARPGVLAAWTAADLPGPRTMPVAEFPPPPPLTDVRLQPILASEELCHQGEALAAVVATSVEAATDALAAIETELEPLPGVGGAVEATAEGAPPAHAGAAGNVAGRSTIEFGDIEAAFAGAAVTVSATLSLARICGAAMEPRSVTAVPQPDGTLLLRTSTQSVFGVRDAVTATLGLEPDRVRVVAEDVGGGFGAKGSPYPEEVLVALAARRLGRPVRWVASRSEDGATTNQSHGNVLGLELAAEADGRLRGLRGRVLHDMGAYAGEGAGQAANIVLHTLSVYRLPAMRVEIWNLYTNSAPTGFIRGGGREVGNFAIERLMDRLADRLGLPRDLVRERNLLRPEDMPYDTGLRMGPAPVRYDLGDVPAMLSRLRAMTASVPVGVEAGRARGMGIACYAESTGFGQREPARLHLARDGTVTVCLGSTPQGQGHQTMAAQIVAERLGWPIGRVRVVAGDSAAVPYGLLTAGSRSAVHVGNAAAGVALEARRRLLELAAERLEADPADLTLSDGVVAVRGAPSRRVGAPDLVPDAGLEVAYDFSPRQGTTWACGCLAVVVEVDLETCRVDVVRSLLVHDSGRLINPVLAEGQLHGGLAHGIGYALFEDAAYEPDGNQRAPSFLDYAIVSAPEMALSIQLEHQETPSPANPEGFRGIGESATIPAPAAICSAIEDALHRAGRRVELHEIPVTPEALFRQLGVPARQER
ncbi:MAG TPA: xanthine dehydrogenase family protein molybdopterin-binding subunit [Candidatus Dormibacteraeota bacterium]|nr:xanthine dehydrogenase family protein molybdopterin-binding subunit [Candidatus Dormibacteraeota bacterium]